MKSFVRDKIGNWTVLTIALAITLRVCAETFGQVAEDSQPQSAANDPSASGPAPAIDEPKEQVVVLRDGGVMSGRVSRSGERYVLSRGSGETYIPATNVLIVASSLQDAYQQRRQRLSQPAADGHLELAEWCLRHDLLTHAEQELADARALDPRHVGLELLERRLTLAKLRRSKPATRDASTAPRTERTQIPTRSVQTDVGNLPIGAVERFTRKVQPVLVNSCTTAGCHELGGTSKFQLDRAMLRGMSNRRSTMNNLTATLSLVDFERPGLSPLLTVPRRTHGGLKSPVFGPRREAAFRHIYDWVMLVTAKTATTPPAEPTDESPDATDNQAGSSGTASTITRSERPTAGVDGPAFYSESKTTVTVPGDELQSDAASDSTTNGSKLRYGARLEHWQPRDPFDPEIFNRKFGAKTITSEPNAGDDAKTPPTVPSTER
jgi:hypothetical protein